MLWPSLDIYQSIYIPEGSSFGCLRDELCWIPAGIRSEKDSESANDCFKRKLIGDSHPKRESLYSSAAKLACNSTVSYVSSHSSTMVIYLKREIYPGQSIGPQIAKQHYRGVQCGEIAEDPPFVSIGDVLL